MKFKELLKPNKWKIILTLILLIILSPKYYHYYCINLAGVECKLFDCPASCGFFLLEFLIVVLISYLLSCILIYIYNRIKRIKKSKPKK